MAFANTYLLSPSSLYKLNPVLFSAPRRSRFHLRILKLRFVAVAASHNGVFTSPEIAKSFDFTSEERIYNWWDSQGYFKPKYDGGSEQPFVVTMPPPNVTGSLHMGHAMFVTLEDIMIRYNRMKGRPTLWLPGTDHAGIATQMAERDAQCSIYNATFDTQFGFCCDLDEETSQELACLPEVLSIKPDPHFRYVQKDYSDPNAESGSNNNIFPPLFPDGSSKHWVVRVEMPKSRVSNRAQLVEHYTEMLTKVLGKSAYAPADGSDDGGSPNIAALEDQVTLLYFIIGRTPFVGDPDQNIKEIAKFRGSEDLWEVAKLHDRESSFPPELFQVQSLASIKLQEWCKQNTRRLDFLEVIPNSLIDLVDKCLIVNPRLRISAEEALKHEFFVPCFNELEKQRLIRQKLAHSNSHSVNCQSSKLKNVC